MKAVNGAKKYCVSGFVVLLALLSIERATTAQDDVGNHRWDPPATAVLPQEASREFVLRASDDVVDSSHNFILANAITAQVQLQKPGRVASVSWTADIPEGADPDDGAFSPRSQAIPHGESERLPRPESPEPNGFESVHPSRPQELTPSRLPLPMSEMSPVACACGNGGCQGCDNGNGRYVGQTRMARFINGVFHGVCRADPCYQAEWTMLANASLFTDALRPQSRQRYRWEYSDTYRRPDRAEYLWARSGGLGPAAVGSLNLHELSMYIETGSERFSFFVKTPYRSMYLDDGRHFAGFADLTTGTKTLLHDTGLLQVAMQFETHIPSSSPGKGLGNGHVALEPSLLFGVHLSEKSFLQSQISEWIPIAGDPDFAGALLKYSFSYNRTLLGDVRSTSLVGTVEFSGISFQDGAYTDSVTLLPVAASNHTLGRMGGGLRLNICNKVNVGLGAQFGLTDDAPDAVVRTEIQFRR